MRIQKEAHMVHFKVFARNDWKIPAGEPSLSAQSFIPSKRQALIPLQDPVCPISCSPAGSPSSFFCLSSPCMWRENVRTQVIIFVWSS